MLQVEFMPPLIKRGKPGKGITPSFVTSTANLSPMVILCFQDGTVEYCK